MKVLVLNCGSSSVKFQLLETDLDLIEKHEERLLAKGHVEKIGMTRSIIYYAPEGKPEVKDAEEILEHREAIRKVRDLLTHPEHGVVQRAEEIEAVGHRVVHGGEEFSGSAEITPEVLEQIRECVALAPLHNPHNITGYLAAKELFSDVPHVAVFDTAYHQTMEPHAYIYGIPYVLYQRHGIRRYGFHGTSHRYVAFRASQILGVPREKLRMVTAHLGNGSSMTAIKYGRSVDTSMGFTPLEGLLMGTRCGDIDPAVILHIMAKEELSLHEANTLMNKHSGLYGVSGVSSDLREVLSAAEEGNKRATLSVDIMCYRIRKYIAAYAAAMGGADVVVFTGGIGENAVSVRAKSCQDLEFMGIEIDPAANGDCVKKEGTISTNDSKVKVMVVPTNEELIIARDTVRCVRGVPKDFSPVKEKPEAVAGAKS